MDLELRLSGYGLIEIFSSLQDARNGGWAEVKHGNAYVSLLAMLVALSSSEACMHPAWLPPNASVCYAVVATAHTIHIAMNGTTCRCNAFSEQRCGPLWSGYWIESYIAKPNV
jgi:hypothetical protein